MAQGRGALGSVRHAMQYPQRARRYLRRLRRDAVLRLRHRDHIAYYSAVVDDAIVHGEATAVGNTGRRGWNEIGLMQFDYLKRHGLTPQHHLLEIGCGNLRAGWRFINYLDAGNYYGIDISLEVLFAAQAIVADHDLADKLPHLTLVKDMTFSFLPAAYFDVVHAHSVFSHSPLAVIEECFSHLPRVMKPDAFFDFTFNRTDGTEHARLGEDWYYRTESLVAAAERHGLKAEFMDDWEQLGHVQSKLRVTRG